MTIHLDVVTAERAVYSEDVDLVVVPGIGGELGILPQHTPLMTMIQPGELRVSKDGKDFYIVISGGFVEVRPDHVIILADAAERETEIDVARAEAARQRAQDELKEDYAKMDLDSARAAEASLRRSLARLKVAEKRRGRNRPPQS